mgnify:FL=1
MTVKELFELEFIRLDKENQLSIASSAKFKAIREYISTQNFDDLFASKNSLVIQAILKLCYALIRESQNDIVEGFYQSSEEDPEALGVEVNESYESAAAHYGEVSCSYYSLDHKNFRLSWEITQPFSEWHGPTINEI